jgi:S-formylglutathione hydrolase FrmB
VTAIGRTLELAKSAAMKCRGLIRNPSRTAKLFMCLGAVLLICGLDDPTFGHVDTVPPTVTAVTPVAGASDQGASLSASATFSEAVRPSSISFVLHDASNRVVASGVTYDAIRHIATLRLNAPLIPSRTYTAVVSGVADLSGNVMKAPLEWSFSTGAAVAPTFRSMEVGTPTTDENGVKYYPVKSAYQGGETEIVRVLEPSNPPRDRPRRLLYVLPVEAGLTTRDSNWGDGLEEMRLLDVQDRYNLTLIAPSFSYEPWYGDNPLDSAKRMESFLINDLVPWGDSFMPAGASPQRLVLGFSKSGNAALFLIFRHPDTFMAAAAWDAPAQLHDITTFPGLEQNFETEENYDQYVLPNLLKKAAPAFRKSNRIWISGDRAYFTADMDLLHSQMQAAGIQHTYANTGNRTHYWYTGWLAGAVGALADIGSPTTSRGTEQRRPAAELKRSQLSSPQTPENSLSR